MTFTLKTGLLSLALLISGFVKGQQFTLSDTLVEISNVTHNGPAHWYTQISNNTNVPLSIIWEVDQLQGPGSWSFSIGPPDGHLYNLEVVDSSGFILQANLPHPEKIIIALNPNDITGSGSASILFSQENLPDQSVLVTFHFTIDSNILGVGNLQKSDFKIWQTKTRLAWEIPLPYRIYDLKGQLLYKGKSKFVTTNGLSSGLYFLSLNQHGHLINHKFLIP